MLYYESDILLNGSSLKIKMSIQQKTKNEKTHTKRIRFGQHKMI